MTQPVKLIKLTSSEKKQVCNSILNISEFSSAGVRFIESGVKDDFVKPTNLSPKIWVCIKCEVSEQNAINNVNREKRDIEDRPKKIAESIVSAAFSCGAAVVAGAAAFGAGAAAIPSFGTTAPLAIISWAGTVATSAKCGTDMAKALNESLDNEWFNPENNEILDKDKAFKYAETALTIVENANLIGSISAGKKLLELSKLTGKSLPNLLKGGDLKKSEALEISKYLYLRGAKSKTAAKNSFNSMIKSGKKPDVIAIKEIGKLKDQLMAAVNEALKKISQSTATTFFVYILTEE